MARITPVDEVGIEREIGAAVGFADRMIATNDFDSLLRVDADGRLLPDCGRLRSGRAAEGSPLGPTVAVPGTGG
jgi:hypothetical protein